jgi:hypothetical protein
MTKIKKAVNFIADILYGRDAIELILKIKIAIEDLIQ